MAKLRKSQVGSKNTKRSIVGKTTKRTLAPFGKIFPQKGVGHTDAQGNSRRGKQNKVSRRSSTRKSTPAPELFSMDYPANKPYAWPVESPPIGANGRTSGYTSSVANRNNAQVNKAFQRGGYAG